MHKYKVEVTRTGYARAFVEVLANNSDEALEAAINEAADIDFSEYDNEKNAELGNVTKL